MSAGVPVPLQIPETLQEQLLDFRRRLWAIKLSEAVGAALAGLMLAFVITYGLDRFWDTPPLVRAAMLLGAFSGAALVPWAAHRWVWKQRRLEQLARLLSRKHPSVGDQLLGILELAHDPAEQARSRTLCAAAIEHVAEHARKRNFRDAVPNPRHREYLSLAGLAGVLAIGLFSISPAAGTNAWQRLLTPWRDIPRYTFTLPRPLPDRLVVPHGEAYQWTVSLASETRSRPSSGMIHIGPQPAVTAELRDGDYQFELPPQIEPTWLTLTIGDYFRRIRLEPMLRPELSSLAADIHLPDYLARPESIQKDVRSGTLAVVQGSQVSFTAHIGREVQAGQIDGEPANITGRQMTASPVVIQNSRQQTWEWTDVFGLSGREPFTISITAQPDEAPTLFCENLPRRKVVLDTETLSFRVLAQDDFGIKQIGMEWRAAEPTALHDQLQGERILAGGAPDQESLNISGTFSAASLGISPQPIALRLFTVDYLLNRERVYAPTSIFYVLTADQHAIWITEQLSKWHQMSLEVRDRELALYETNQQLRELSDAELNRAVVRTRLDTQAAAERANGRRLTGLVASGEDLVQQAARNPEMGVGHLEKWAEMLQILKDISGNRMPSVAELLKEAAQANPGEGTPAQQKAGPTAGQNRSTPSGTPSNANPNSEAPKPVVPQVTDGESSQQPVAEQSKESPLRDGPPSNPKLRLPTTMVPGGGNSKSKPGSKAAQSVQTAVKQQADLLAEFDKIAEELNRVLANLEGSTLVKRLKAAARLQNQIAVKIGEQVSDSFGVTSSGLKAPQQQLFTELGHEEAKSGLDVSHIMDDMQAFFERRRYAKFQSVLEEMRKEDVIGSLRNLSDDIPKESGLSLAMCEYWSDTLDRWAEDLVDPACKGSCPGCKSKGSLPPSIVLEVLQVLEAEVNLREETRVAEQAKTAVASDDHRTEATRQSQLQTELQDRIDKVEVRIRDLPDAEADFAYEIQLMSQVSNVMADAARILARPETGAPAIAAETEAIELLLKSKRFNPKGGGGGGGSTPGGGGGGDTTDSALALLGKGINNQEVRDDHGVSQASGETGRRLPEEFRAGLDSYFSRLESPDSRP
ncbi:MAG: hypothetical protein U0872_02810 [Planctomycetaceae bacterium]